MLTTQLNTFYLKFLWLSIVSSNIYLPDAIIQNGWRDLKFWVTSRTASYQVTISLKGHWAIKPGGGCCNYDAANTLDTRAKIWRFRHFKIVSPFANLLTYSECPSHNVIITTIHTEFTLRKINIYIFAILAIPGWWGILIFFLIKVKGLHVCLAIQYHASWCSVATRSQGISSQIGFRSWFWPGFPELYKFNHKKGSIHHIRLTNWSLGDVAVI